MTKDETELLDTLRGIHVGLESAEMAMGDTDPELCTAMVKAHKALGELIPLVTQRFEARAAEYPELRLVQ